MNHRYWLEPVFSVIRRDILITVRYPTWFIASFFWPVIFPLTYFFTGKGLAGTGGQGLEAFSRYAGTGDYASFLILGSLVWMFVNINLWMGGLSLQQDRERGAFDTQWCMPVSKLSLVVGSTLASMLLNFLPMLASIFLYTAMGTFRLSGNFFSLFGAVLAVMPFLTGFLLVFAAFTLRLRQASMLVMIVRSLLSIICGLQFPLSVLPSPVAKAGAWVPLTHFIDLIRSVVIRKEPLSAHAGSVRYLLASGTVMLLLGVLSFQLVKRSVRKNGLSSAY